MKYALRSKAKLYELRFAFTQARGAAFCMNRDEKAIFPAANPDDSSIVLALPTAEWDCCEVSRSSTR